MTVLATNNISINRVTENLDLTLTFSMDAVAEARREVLRLYDIISAMEKPVAPVDIKNFSSNDKDDTDILNDSAAKADSSEAEEPKEEPKKAASMKTRTRKSRSTEKAEEPVKESEEEPETEEPEEAADDDPEEEKPLTIKEIRKLAHDCADGSSKGRMEVKKALRKYTKVGAMAGLQEKDYTAFYNDLVDIYYSLHPEEAEDAEEE